MPSYITWDYIPLQTTLNAQLSGFSVTIKQLDQAGDQWSIEFDDSNTFNSSQETQIITAIQNLRKPKFLN